MITNDDFVELTRLCKYIGPDHKTSYNAILNSFDFRRLSLEEVRQIVRNIKGKIGSVIEDGRIYPKLLLIKFKDITHINTIEDFEILLELLEDALKPPHCNQMIQEREVFSRNAAQFHFLSQ